MKVTNLAPALFALMMPFAADAKLAASGGASVSFAAVGPAGMRIVGSSSDLTIADDAQNITVTVPLGNLKTGVDLRDQHMRDKYLEVPKYPNAQLVVAKSAIKMPAAGGDSSGDAQGTMNLHGKSKNVTFHYVARKDGGTMKVGGTVRVDMRDYGISIPSYMGVTVKPEVDVEVKFGAQE